VNLENKNVLVTGGAGFVGGHLVEELIKLQRIFKRNQKLLILISVITKNYWL